MAWVRMRAVGASGRHVDLELKVKREVVEWWLDHRAVAMTDRERLRAWLDAPRGDFAAHDVSLSHSRSGYVVEVEDRAEPSLLDPAGVRQLRRQLWSA